MPRALPRQFLQAVLEIEAVFLADPLAKFGDIRHPAVVDKGVALLYAERFALLRKALRKRFGIRTVLHVEIFHVLYVLEKQIVAAGVEHDEHALELVQVAP